MELRQLKYFVVVAEELHFTRAAERLHIAQQPLSFQIKQLEEELNVQLFHRTTRHVSLTEAGQLFLNEVQIALKHLEQGIEAAQSVEQEKRGRLVVGYITTTLYKFLPETVRRFRERFPTIELVLNELLPATLVQQLETGEIDVGLTIREEQQNFCDDVKWETICSENVVVALPKNHPLAKAVSIPLSALENEAFVIYEKHAKRYLYDWIVAECHKVGFRPQIVQEAASEQAVVNLVAAGMGIALVAACLSNIQISEIIYRPLIKPSIEIQFIIAQRRNHTSALVQALHEIASTVATVLPSTNNAAET